VLRIGQRFGDYELQERLGDGGSGVVYRAREISLGRPVALRIIPPQTAPDATTRARLNREVTLLAALDHPNVVPVYEVGEQDGMLFVATRWINGRTLDTVVAEEGALSPRRAVRIVNQVAGALQAAHEGGIAHRGVRPSSALVTDTDFVYLTDFGLARRSGDMTGLTVQEQLLDKYDFVAPEYIAGQEVDGRADIYGLGGVLYFALTGEVPFPAPNPSAKLYAHTASPAPAPSRLNPDVPSGLDEVVQRAMAKAPEDRQDSAAQFAFEAASAVEMSSPPWSAHHEAAPSRLAPSPQLAPSPTHEPEPAAPPSSDRSIDAEPAVLARSERFRAPAEPEPEPRPGAGSDGFTEQVIYGHQKRVRARVMAWAVALVAFVAAPVALLIAALH
jgi:serine/threonine protein kinase